MKRYIRSDEQDTPEDLFSPDVKTRQIQAKLTNDPDLLEIYAYDPESNVRQYAAGNPHTPQSALLHLAEDTSPQVILHLCTHAKVPGEVLARLYREFPIAVSAVAFNPNTPMDILEEIIRGSDPDTASLILSVWGDKLPEYLQDMIMEQLDSEGAS